MKYERMLAVLLINILVFASCSVQAQELPYNVYLVSPAINNYAILPEEPLPKVCTPGTTMKIMACRGEYEPASFLIRTRQPLQAVMVDVSPLTDSAGTLATQSIDIRIVQPIFRRVTNYPGLTPWLLVHDPNALVVENKPDVAHTKPGESVDGTWVTAHLKHKVLDSTTLQPVDIVDLRQFWITVHIPDNARPGKYVSTVRITPQNAPPTDLRLEVIVPSFELLTPKFEYSVYYPAYLASPDRPYSFNTITDKQYLAELKNMVAHGCTNPNIYGETVKISADGSLDFSLLERIVSLREQAGIHTKTLYLAGHPLSFVSRKLTSEERGSMVHRVREIVAWAKVRGFDDVYFMAIDEASGEKLRGERDSFRAIHAGGGKVFVACGGDFFDLVGDLLDLPVLIHPGHGPIDAAASQLNGDQALRKPEKIEQAGNPRKLLSPNFQKKIKGVHENGFKIFTYMDPIAGRTLPELHRRNRGLGLWKSGLDGTMTWAYTHIAGPSKNADLTQQWQPMPFAFVWRTHNGVIDTLGWEGFREGVDDARYVTTLLAALRKAKAAGTDARLVAQTERWLDTIEVDTDLDKVRLEMARRIEGLLDR